MVWYAIMPIILITLINGYNPPERHTKPLTSLLFREKVVNFWHPKYILHFAKVLTVFADKNVYGPKRI